MAQVVALDRKELPPLAVPQNFRHDVTYFCTPAGEPGAPETLGEGEYFVRREDARQAYDDGVIRLVSPLDSATSAELEITEEQEVWLEWMLQHDVQHIRVER